MEIYADIVFIINFAMDAVVFTIAGKLTRIKTKPWRLLLGSGICAALYCVIALSSALSQYYNFFTMTAVLMIGLLIAFNPKTIMNMAKLVAFSNIAAFAIGGAYFAFFYYLNIGDIIGSALILSPGSNLPIKILIAATAFSYIIIKLLMIRSARSVNADSTYYNVTILLDDKEISVTALLDTGNFLLDPFTNDPVIIVEFSAVKDLLPDCAKTVYYEKKHDELLELMNAFSKSAFLNRVRILPYSSLGKQNGMLIGFKPDIVHIIEEEGGKVVSKEAVIGIYNYELSKDGSFRALLNPHVL